MPVSRRTHDAAVLAITADRERIRRERDQAREERDAVEHAMRTMARQIDDLTEEARRTAAERLGQDRLIRDQQRQLDELLGLNGTDVLAGSQWQERRPDKPKPVAPDHEPGEVA